jgi:hypothetical protein
MESKRSRDSERARPGLARRRERAPAETLLRFALGVSAGFPLARVKSRPEPCRVGDTKLISRTVVKVGKKIMLTGDIQV